MTVTLGDLASSLADRYVIERELGAGGLEPRIAQKQADANADVVW